jgi:hypothetical protein
MDKNERIQPFDKGVAARTNMLRIIDSPEQLITKLIAENNSVGVVNYLCKEIHREKNEETEVYYRRVDSEIKSAIRRKLGLENTDLVKYDRLSNKKNRFMFFFVDKSACSDEKLLVDVTKYNFDLDKVVQTLLSLRLKLAYIDDVSTYYEIEPALYNSKLYIGIIERTAKPKYFKEGESLIEALELDLYFSKQHEIAISLHKRAFCCEDIFTPVTNDSCLLFHHKGKTLQKKDNSLDAVSYAKRPYMAYSQKKEAKAFDKYENCINYHLTVAINKLINVLSDAEIAFSPVEFKANYIASEFIESTEQYSNPLIIIDAFSSYKTDEERTEFREYLKQTFGAKSVIGIEDAPKPEELETEDLSYLIINQEKQKNGSSIVKLDTAEVLNSFFQALVLYVKDNNISFDYYTRVKIHRFLKKRQSVTQGTDIGSVTKQQSQKDDNGNKLPATTILNELDKNKIQKIKTELWLKERVFHYRSIEGINFPDLELVLFYVRKLKNKQVYVSVVNVTTSENGLKINNHERYESNEKSRFDFAYPYLKCMFPNTPSCFDEMYDQGFYLYDKTHQKLLISYSSANVPNIIGNAAFDNAEKNKLANGINRQRPPEKCVLPYYINPTLRKNQLHHVFLEDFGQEGVIYFVSKAGQPDAKIDKQRLIQNILVFNQDGSKAFPLEEELTTLFLKSFTFDLLNNKEVSKKSIFQKIAELYIEN